MGVRTLLINNMHRPKYIYIYVYLRGWAYTVLNPDVSLMDNTGTVLQADFIITIHCKGVLIVRARVISRINV